AYSERIVDAALNRNADRPLRNPMRAGLSDRQSVARRATCRASPESTKSLQCLALDGGNRGTTDMFLRPLYIEEMRKFISVEGLTPSPQYNWVLRIGTTPRVPLAK